MIAIMLYTMSSCGRSSVRRRLPRRGPARLRDERGAQLRRDGRVLVEVGERLVAALADLLAAVRVPGARLLDEPELLGGVDQLAELVDAGAEQDLELGLAERRRALVLDDLDLD